jgi:hypothetical protein
MVERPYLSQALRQRVAERAEHLCEYCLIHEHDTAFGCAIDHIISLKHGGTNEFENLAYACVFCNRFKGSDIGSIIWKTQTFVCFYHPRRDRWSDHFQLQDDGLQPLTEIGQVTAKILGFNHDEQLLERQFLIAQQKYPHLAALKRMSRS